MERIPPTMVTHHPDSVTVYVPAQKKSHKRPVTSRFFKRSLTPKNVSEDTTKASVETDGEDNILYTLRP